MIHIKLDEVLKKKGKTIYWLSQQTGIDQHALHNLSKNITQKTYFSTLDKILNVLECPIEELLEHIPE